MTGRRARAALLLGVLAPLVLSTSCTGEGADDPAPTASRSGSAGSLPHKGNPVPGVVASALISAARAALPGSLQEDTRWARTGYVTYTHTEIGYPGEHDSTKIGTNAPAITIFWEDDGSVSLAGCSDLVSAGLSRAMAVCTDLPITGVPDGALRANFNAYPAQPWRPVQPFPQIVIFGFDYPAHPHPPNTGTARSFSVYGPDPPSVAVTDTSSL